MRTFRFTTAPEDVIKQTVAGPSAWTYDCDDDNRLKRAKDSTGGDYGVTLDRDGNMTALQVIR
jgi:hypothetical protein